MIQNTKGPWKWYGSELLSEDSFVLECSKGNLPNKYDALLIATSPEILDALINILDAYKRGAQGFPLPYEVCKAAEESAENAIAKATGK